MREGTSQRHVLSGSPWVVGRDPSVEFRVEDDKASRRHASFKLINGRPCVEDLGSFNGVRVNGKRIDIRATLRPGDVVQVGRTVFTLRADHAGADPSDADTLVLARAVLAAKEGRARFVVEGECRIGRGSDSHVYIDDPSISREHAQITFPPERPPRLRDLESANGSFVNGRRIRWSELRDGDLIRFGDRSFHLEAPAWPMDETQREAQTMATMPGWLFRGGLALALLAGVGWGAAAFWPDVYSSATTDPSTGLSAPSNEGASPEEEAGLLGTELPLSEIEAMLSGLSQTATEASMPSTRSAPPAASVRPPRQREPPVTERVVGAYLRGDVMQALRLSGRLEARSATAWRLFLTRADALYDRALTEVSNDPYRAQGFADALARMEAKAMPHGSKSFLVVELENALVNAYLTKGRSAFLAGRFARAYGCWRSAEELAPDDPAVQASLQRIDALAQRWSTEAEKLGHLGSKACALWQRIPPITAPESDLHRTANRRIQQLCR